MTIKAFIERNAVPSYFALVFAISWGSVLVLGVPYGMPTSAEQSEELWAIVILPYFIGPCMAGLLMTRIVHGRTGLRGFVSRLLKWRVGARWYVVALLAAPLLVTPLLLAFSRFSPDFLPGISTAGDVVGLLLTGIVTGLVFGGLMEESGWTGFAVPNLRRRHSVVTTGLIVGVLWGVWHFPPKILLAEAFGLAPFLVVDLLTAVLNLTAWRILLVWVNDRAGSLLVTMLMHGSFTACTLFILAPSATGVGLVTYNLVAAAAAWGVVAAVGVANGWQLSRQPVDTNEKETRHVPIQEVQV